MASETTQSTSSPLLIAFAWLVVLIPAGWGLTLTAQNAAKIFTKGTPAAATAAPASVTVTAPPTKQVPVAPPLATPAAK